MNMPNNNTSVNANEISFTPLSKAHYDDLIALGNLVHGDNYLTETQLKKYHAMGIKDGINASWVALYKNQLVGFRLTFAAQQWSLDDYCSVPKWPVPAESVCYFKCNTVKSSLRGAGIGSALLKHSINSVVQQGGKAGLAHIWAQSPGNSAFKYFSKCGGRLIAEHPGKWNINCIEDGYVCNLCDVGCDCVALEMMVAF